MSNSIDDGVGDKKKKRIKPYRISHAQELEKKNPFLLTREPVTKTRVFFAGWIEQKTMDNMKLHTALWKKSITRIVQDALNFYLEQHGEPLDAIIETLSDRAIIEWRNRANDLRNIQTFPQYLTSVLKTLKGRKIHESIINKIEKRIRSKIGK